MSERKDVKVITALVCETFAQCRTWLLIIPVTAASTMNKLADVPTRMSRYE